MLAYVLQGPSDAGGRITSPVPDVGQSAEEFTADNGNLDASALWSSDEANAACQTLGGAFPKYQLTSADATMELRCDYGSEALEGGMMAARVEVWGYRSIEAARAAWQSQFGPASDFANTWPQLEEQGFTYTPEPDRYFLTLSAGHAGKTAYKVQGGLLYQNAIVVFTEMEAADPGTPTWQRVQELARQLVDQANSK